MKRLLHAAIALVCAIGLSVSALGQMTSITATSIQMKGAPIASGTVTFIPVNSVGQPVPITAGGSLYDGQGFTAAITNGAVVGTFEVPDSCTASPVTANTSLFYAIQIYNSTTKQSFTLQHVTGVCGENWNLDSYVPTQTAVVSSTGLVSGTTVPAHCSNTSIFYKQSSPSAVYTCVAGMYVQMSGDGGSIDLPHTTGLFKGDGDGGALAATAGTDYATPASVTTAASAAASAQATADAAIPAAQKGAANGVASLDSNSKVPLTLLPDTLYPPVAGASAEYSMTDGSGPTVTDISGNGKNATFGSGSNSPTWYTYGVSFLDTGTAINPPQYIVTPITTFGTVYVAECTSAMVQTTGNSYGGVPANTYPSLVGAVGGSGGIAFLGVTSSQNISNAIRPSIFKIGSGMTTVATGAYGGCHVYGFSAGSTTDHFTVDGVEPADYTSQTSSASFVPVTGGTYYIGSASTLNGFGLRGVVTYAMFYPTTHATAQMAQVTKYIQSKLAVRATYPQYPVLTNSRSATALFILDSLTAGYQGSSAWTGTLTLNHTYDVQNWAIGGMLALDGCTLSANRWEQQIVPGITTVQVWGGTNDFVSGRTASDIIASLATCAATIKKHNGRAIAVTMISRSNNDSNKNALNALLRADYKQLGFDYLNDIAAVPELGADGAYSNTACFNSDQTHLTGPGAGTCATIGSTALSGYGVVAALSSNAINTMDGSSQSNPDQTTSTAFISTYANNFVIQTPASDATYQLVDCQGQTSPRTLVNGSAANTITVNPVNGQTITGSSTVSANSSAIFMPVLSSPTAGGCSWLRVQ